jgi:hypothetical protein
MNLLAYLRRKNAIRELPDVELVAGLRREAAPFGPARHEVLQAIADGHRAVPTAYTRRLQAIKGGHRAVPTTRLAVLKGGRG